MSIMVGPEMSGGHKAVLCPKLPDALPSLSLSLTSLFYIFLAYYIQLSLSRVCLSTAPFFRAWRVRIYIYMYVYSAV